jgi:hypothetical protein
MIKPTPASHVAPQHHSSHRGGGGPPLKNLDHDEAGRRCSAIETIVTSSVTSSSLFIAPMEVAPRRRLRHARRADMVGPTVTAEAQSVLPCGAASMLLCPELVGS